MSPVTLMRFTVTVCAAEEVFTGTSVNSREPGVVVMTEADMVLVTSMLSIWIGALLLSKWRNAI